MKWQHLVLLLLLATAAVVRAEEEAGAEVDDDEEFDEERAVLLVRRSIADERPLEGKQTTVTISLYNAGNAAASGVKVVDGEWPAEGFAVEGDLSATFDSIPVGASVQHSYKVTGKEAGVYQHPAATVTYKPADEEAEQTATSQPLVFRTYTIAQTVTIKILQLGSRLSGGSLNSIDDWKRASIVLGVGLAAIITYRSYGSVSESQRNRRRQKALAELAALEKEK